MSDNTRTTPTAQKIIVKWPKNNPAYAMFCLIVAAPILFPVLGIVMATKLRLDVPPSPLRPITWLVDDPDVKKPST